MGDKYYGHTISQIKMVNNIVVDEYSKRLKAQNPRAYGNIIRMARLLGMNVRFVKVLDGLITNEGIFINADAKNPSRFVAKHEFCHSKKSKSIIMSNECEKSRYYLGIVLENGRSDRICLL